MQSGVSIRKGGSLALGLSEQRCRDLRDADRLQQVNTLLGEQHLNYSTPIATKKQIEVCPSQPVAHHARLSIPLLR